MENTSEKMDETVMKMKKIAIADITTASVRHAGIRKKEQEHRTWLG